ncbi:uncharacterized protein MICPUCDRAFT_54867 [Micromonas pusilla CCMP1545]|uniref:Predicted protein n=1 Tax=Micromonas pusilla (strain CCMP1545) TaxID=564608 RepID=C1NAE4_MICPC|nr:uncharacterized protein MICPUCDRAFT_54867 [Micromonas pusilla CCMP1545]EEH50930.1 predicted protein [Micromonas pusilla CCMP1545]|eukprot:XP_003064950.1 predicted protein [Micromonas pusilla CCMP1545]
MNELRGSANKLLPRVHDRGCLHKLAGDIPLNLPISKVPKVLPKYGSTFVLSYIRTYEGTFVLPEVLGTFVLPYNVVRNDVL